MAKDSPRSVRGWTYAVIVAVCLIAIFIVGESVSRIRRPSYEVSPRQTTLTVSTKLRNLPKIVSEPVPINTEPLDLNIQGKNWNDYRTEAPSSISMVERPAGVRLTAPIASELPDPFLESIQKPSITTFVSADSASVVAKSVSVERMVPNESRLNANLNNNALVSKSWPTSAQLETEIARIRGLQIRNPTPSVADWIVACEATIESLSKVAIYDDASKAILEKLNQSAQDGYGISRELLKSDIPFASAISRLAYSLERRFGVWNSVHECVRTGREHFIAARNYEIDNAKLAHQLDLIRKALPTTGDVANWTQYLLLNDLGRLADGTIESREDQVTLAREFLSRVLDRRVTEVQRKFLSAPEIHKLADQIHPLTITPVDYRKLLVDIETLESNPVHRYSAELADAIQSLRFSEHPEQAAIAHTIGQYYRNANIRVSVSQDFINRMMPKPQMIDRPVQQKILGADTRGASQVETQLKVKFVPDKTALHLTLKLDGNVNSNTRSSRNGATFYNSSSAHVDSVREIRIDPVSLQVNGHPTAVDSNDSLRKFSTDWDSLPVVGEMIRHIAHQEFLQSRPIAKRIMQKMIAKQTDEEFDSQLRTRMKTAQQTFDKRLLGPLQLLELQPTIVDMQTLEHRMIVRYRIASNDQISAHTPRPMAPTDSQLSLQLHQSAINNLVGRVVVGNKDWTPQELSDSIADILQAQRRPIPEDSPDDVSVRFVEVNPITVEFEDGRMWLTLRIESFEQLSGGIHLKNFVVRTSFVPQRDGLHAELSREGVVSVDGHRVNARDRLRIRAVFTKVFSGISSLPMVSSDLVNDPRAQGLAISQLEMRDGWFAIAVSDQSSPHMSAIKARTTAR